MGWSDWNERGGQFSTIAATKTRPGVIHLFAHRLNHGWTERVEHKLNPWDTSPWRSLGNIPGAGQIGPATAASWGADRVDLFVNGASTLYQKVLDPGWSNWIRLDGTIVSPPAVCSWGYRRYDVFAVGVDLALYHKWYNGRWSNWHSLGGHWMRQAPAAVSWAQDRVDVFAVGDDRAIHHKHWDGNRWSGWEYLGGVTEHGLAVSSWGRGRLDLFHTGMDRAIWHKWFDGRWRPSQTGWESLGGQKTIGGPAAVSDTPGRIELFRIGQRPHLPPPAQYHQVIWHKSFR